MGDSNARPQTAVDLTDATRDDTALLSSRTLGVVLACVLGGIGAASLGDWASLALEGDPLPPLWQTGGGGVLLLLGCLLLELLFRRDRRRHQQTLDALEAEHAVMQDVFDRAGEAMAGARTREQAMQLAAGAALDLLRAGDTARVIGGVLARIGEVMCVDRVYLFEIHAGADGETLCSQRYEWTRAGVTAEIGNPELQNLSMDRALPNWLGPLRAGRAVGGRVADLPQPERALMESQQIQSMLVVPVVIDEQPWGFLGFDVVRSAHVVAPEDENVLRIIGACLAAAIERRRADDRLQQSEQQLHHLAHHDPLTELPNRLFAQGVLEHALDRARFVGTRAAVLFLDLDGFKRINDSLGHPVGDRLLVAVADRLRPRIRGTDTLARLGGDEFIVIVEQLHTAADAAQIARKLLAALMQPLALDGRDVVIGASIGISVFPDDGDSASDLIRNADTAMYQAKAQGRGQVCFYTADMNAQALDQLELEAALRHALQHDGFELHYQPKYDLARERVIGFEALLRLRAADGALIAPDRFIPLAERSGLIVPIGAWVLEAACRQARAWRDAGHPQIGIAVNVSARQFGCADFAEHVERALVLSGLPAGALELELTESLLMDDPQMATDRLAALKRIGVVVSLDDFGTGYSSLGYLMRFPIDALKIDKSFVGGLGVDAHADDIVGSIIALARRMRLRVIAEGVETATQADYLQAHGCDEVQGYLLSRPLPAEQALAWLDRGVTLAGMLSEA